MPPLRTVLQYCKKTISGETALAVSILLCRQGLLEARAGDSTRGAVD